MPHQSDQIHPVGDHLLSVADLETNLARLAARVKAGKLRTLAEFVFMLQLDGRPMSMHNHRAFEAFFELLPPDRLLFKTCRQVGKTQQGAAGNTIERVFRPRTKALIVTPFFSQVHRISTEVAAPLSDRSLFRDSILTNSRQQVLKRKYANDSIDLFSYACMDATRIRSIAGVDRLWVDEIQNVHADILPVIEATQYARPNTGWKWFTGTPLSMNNLIELLWQESSQAEEAVRCRHCNEWNYACVEYHLLKMIGEETAVCHKCGKKLPVHEKVFIPRFPDREDIFPGRHVSQILAPVVTESAVAWRKLRRLMNSPTYTKAQLYNEVFGESFDSADRMITQPELAAACRLGPNTFDEALKRRKELATAAVGIDWTGGGRESQSFTKVAFGGMSAHSNEVRVHYLHVFPKSMPVQEQVAQTLRMIERYNPAMVCHDYSGSGWLFETLGIDWRLDRSILMPFTFGFHPSREVIYADPEEREGVRSSLHIDRTRSLLSLYTMLKAGKVLLPDWDLMKDPDTGTRPVDDFLNLFTEASPSWRSGDLLFVKTDPKKSDDMVFAVNLLAAGCWFAAGALPSVPQLWSGARTQPTEEEAADAVGRFEPTDNWNDDEDDLDYDPRKHLV